MSRLEVLAMGRTGWDNRHSKDVEKILGSLMERIEVGQTKQVATKYQGTITCSVGGDKKCNQYKCLFCTWMGPGDARRRARHFLPTGLPKSFWDKGDHAGIALCCEKGGAPPADVIDKLADLKCQEFVKAKAFLAGQSTDGMHTMAKEKNMNFEEAKAKKNSEPSSLCQLSIDDDRRYAQDPIQSRDVARLLCWAFWDADIPERQTPR